MNCVLVRPPLSVDAMTLGIIYFVFLPSILTTPLAGRAVKRFGTRVTFWGALAVAAFGLPLMLSSSLPRCWPAWCWLASAPFSRRPRRPALSDGPRPRTAARQVTSTLPSTSSAD